MPPPPYILGLLPNIRVAYRASAEPQELHVDLDLSEPDPHGFPAIRMRDLVASINAGAAGGAEFAPEAGFARILSGPKTSLNPADWHAGPSFRWILEVRGVSPFFLRSLVETMSVSADPIAPVSLSVYGSLRPDATPLSVLDARLMAWSTSSATYPKRWPTLPFTVKEDSVPRGCALRVRFADDADPDTIEALNAVLGLWGLLSITYPNLGRNDVGYRTFIDRLGVNRRECSRFVEEFHVAQDVATTTLFHMLARFSQETAKIEHVDVRTP